MWLLDKFFAAMAQDSRDNVAAGLAPIDPEDMALWVLGADDMRSARRRLRLVKDTDELGGEVAS